MIARFRSFAGRHLPQWMHDVVRHVPGMHGPPRAVHRFTFPVAPARRAASPFNSLSTEGNLLEQLGAKYAPTKRRNNYLRYYWMHCRDIRLDVRNVLETGVQTDRSLRMWEEFFPQLSDHGIYVLEDTGGCVGDYNLVVVNALKTLIDETMYWPTGFDPSRWPELSHL